MSCIRLVNPPPFPQDMVGLKDIYKKYKCSINFLNYVFARRDPVI